MYVKSQKTIAPHPAVPRGGTPPIFTTLHLQVPPKPHTEFQVNPTIGSGDAQSGFRGDAQTRGSRGRTLSIWTNLSLRLPPMPPTKFQVDPTVGSGEEVDSRFWGDAPPRGPPGGHTLHSIKLESTRRPDHFCQVSARSVQRFWRRSRM